MPHKDMKTNRNPLEQTHVCEPFPRPRALPPTHPDATRMRSSREGLAREVQWGIPMYISFESTVDEGRPSPLRRYRLRRAALVLLRVAQLAKPVFHDFRRSDLQERMRRSHDELLCLGPTSLLRHREHLPAPPPLSKTIEE